MKKLQWLKTKVGLFSDPRILYLMHMPNGDSYIVLWFFLKDMAGTVNDGGKVYVSRQNAMTTQFIAQCLHRRRPFIEKGLETLEQLGLLERDENGVMQIAIWDELQNFQRDERCRQQTKERVRRYRQRQQEAAAADVSEMPAAAKEADETAVDTPLPMQESEPIATPKALREYAAVQTYETLFGPMQGAFAQQLADMETMWGSEATCVAIELAHENKVNNIKYIRAILVNSNGRPTRGKRKEDAFHGYANFTDYLAGVLRGEPEHPSALYRSTARESAFRPVGSAGKETGQTADYDA